MPPLTWWELALAPGAGAAVIVGVAAVAGQLRPSALWQRTMWQASTLGLLALVVLQATGSGRGLAELVRLALQRQGAREVTAHDVAAEPQAAEPVEFDFPSTAVLVEPWETAPPVLPGRSKIPPTRLELSPTIAPVASQTLPWLALIWLGGTVILLGRMGWAHALLARFRRSSHDMTDKAVRKRVRVLAARLGMRRPVRVLLADQLLAPVSFGSLRPGIAVPASFFREFDRQQQDAVLAHELAHLAAGDPAWQLLAGVASALLWWQPLAWWSARRLRSASEVAADEASLLVPDGPSALASCLVALGRRLVQPRRLGWLSVGGGGFRSGLGRRVERLLSLRRRSCRAPGRARMVLAKTLIPAALVATSMFCTAWAQPQVTFPEGGTTMSVLKTSWRCSLAATALWAFLGPTPTVSMAGEDRPAEKEKVAPPGRHHDAPLAKPAPAEERKEGETRREERRERPEGEPRPEVRRERREGEGREGDRPVGPDDPKWRELMQHRHHLMEQIEGTKRQLADIKDNESEDARELRAKLKKLTDQLRELPPGPEAPHGDRPPQWQRLEEIKQQIRRLQEEGKHEEAERLKEEGMELMRSLKRGAGRPEGPPEGRGPGRGEGRGNLPQRVQHLQAAAENLRAAGFPEQAEHVTRLIEHITREGGPRPGEPMHPEGRMPPGGRFGPPHPEMGPAVQELRGQIEQMRREMQELREHLKRPQQGEHKDR